ncbi:MAG: ABC transporter substrate-binding protein [Acidobacteriota bacterium]|nr:ABC transporter substrate-binding protein [Acidobacteriota bacterium]
MKYVAAWTFFSISLFAADASRNELRFNLRREPKTLDPLLASEAASEAVRYLTSGVLIRVNRLSQQLEPELAESWKVSPDAKSITFHLRPGILFSDGAPFQAQDVVATLRRVTDPALHSPAGEPFRSASSKVVDSRTLTVTFPVPVANMERLFDQLSIVPARASGKDRASLGPFFISAYQPGVEVFLARNPNYWEKDSAGRRLPYLDAVRLSIQGNQEIEASRFRAGEIDLINHVEPEIFDRLAKSMPAAVHDSGPSTDIDFLWFNLVPSAPLTPARKTWFQSRVFRQAVSLAINRDDISRVVYRGHARPAVGLISPANKFWFNAALKPLAFSPANALKLLESEGFRKTGSVLKDRSGNTVEFSLLIGAGSQTRERTAVLIQQDLQAIGIRVNVVTLDVSSMISRITNTYDYEACLFGLNNIALDPSELMNVLLSSGPLHGWYPNQKTPATQWEAEIDGLMLSQASATDKALRKRQFDRVQEIVRDQEPYLFLVNRNALSAISSAVHNAAPSVLYPETFWNVERLSLK